MSASSSLRRRRHRCVCDGHLATPFGLNLWTFERRLIVHPSWTLFGAALVKLFGFWR